MTLFIIDDSRTRPMVACYTYVQPNFHARPLVACHRRDARIPIAEKISIFVRTNFCRYATMRVANSRLFTVAELQIRQNKGKNVRLQPKGRKNSPEPRVTDAGRRLRSVTVGRNELRHKTPSATSTLKECPNCNS